MKTPKTNYTMVGDLYVAYQAVGDGPIDLVYASGFGAMEMFWDHPVPAHFLERLSSFSRLILFDPRGWGASDRFGPERFPTWEDWAEDLHAVLDAVDSDRSAIFTHAMANTLAMVFSAAYPELTSALILFDSTAKWIVSEDYPWGFESPEAADRVVELVERLWGTDEFIAVTQPNVGADDRYRAWSGKVMRAAGSPRMAAAQIRYMHAFDARSLLPLIQAPTLVLHRMDSPFMPVEHGRYLAEKIPGARLVELPGSDEAPWLESADEILSHVEEFLTGMRRAPQPDRVLATVLFTDIVDSTKRAATIGDAAWKRLLDEHNAIVLEQVETHRGRLVQHTGDGIVATFDGSSRAIRCAVALHRELESCDIRVRAGLHAGEVELRDGGNVGGIAVHIGARVMAEAGPGEIMVSSTVRDLVAGSGIEFDERGTRALKGVPGEWRLHAVRS